MAPSNPEPAANGAELVPAAEPLGMDRLKRRPIIDTIEPRTLALIKAQIAPKCSDAEVGHFLELTAHYGLDPFAKEAWCAKSDRGQLLIMVGRDGLRKIVQRQGLLMDCDVVHANDCFEVTRNPDGSRTVAHAYGHPAKRGDIVGAWAQVRDRGGNQHGFFYAPLDEYKPRNASQYSPWSKQESVMILAAAERQAARQATPLGGLLIEGEDSVVIDNETGQQLGRGSGDGQPVGLDLGPDVEAVIARATELGHAGLADRATIEMQLDGQPPVKVKAWVKAANAELDDLPVDAEIVEPREGAVRHSDAQADDAKAEDPDGRDAAGTAGEAGESVPDPERIAALRRRGEELLADAEALQAVDDPRAVEVFEEADRVMAEVEAAENTNQIGMAI